MNEIERYATDLRRAADTLTQRASQVVRKAAMDTAGDAEVLAPVDTGNLRNSIIVQVESPLIAATVATAEYAVYQEYGTRFQPPQPFMRPAQDRNTNGFIQALSQLVEEV